jgi:hypothetical protein
MVPDFKTGEVWLVYFKNISPPKPKFAVHIQGNSFLFINTKQDSNGYSVRISKSEYKFLAYDSHIGCNQIFDCDESEVFDAKRKGALSNQTIDQITQIIPNVKVLSKLHQDMILDAFKSADRQVKLSKLRKD